MQACLVKAVSYLPTYQQLKSSLPVAHSTIEQQSGSRPGTENIQTKAKYFDIEETSPR
jgi:hypothetical protein